MWWEDLPHPHPYNKNSKSAVFSFINHVFWFFFFSFKILGLIFIDCLLSCSEEMIHTDVRLTREWHVYCFVWGWDLMRIKNWLYNYHPWKAQSPKRPSICYSSFHYYLQATVMFHFHVIFNLYISSWKTSWTRIFIMYTHTHTHRVTVIPKSFHENYN